MMEEACGSTSKDSSESDDVTSGSGDVEQEQQESHSEEAPTTGTSDVAVADAGLESGAESEDDPTKRLGDKRKTGESSFAEDSGNQSKRRKGQEEDEDRDATVTGECSVALPLSDQDSTEKRSETQGSHLKSDASSGPRGDTGSTSLPTTQGDDPDQATETGASDYEDKKPSPVGATSQFLRTAALEARGVQEEGANSVAAVAAALSDTSTRDDPEGVRLVKEIVAQRKLHEDDGGDSVMMDGWFNWLDDLLEYYEKHGHCQVRDAENHILYSWLKRQRIMFRKGKLDPEKLRILQLLKTNGFDKPNKKQAGEKPSTSTRAPGKASSTGKQTSLKEATKEAPAPSTQGLALETRTSSDSAGLPRGQPLPGPSFAPQTSLLPGSITSQPSTAINTFSNLLSSLQAGSGASHRLGGQAYSSTVATTSTAAMPSRQQRQDPPARVAGAPPNETSSSASSASTNILQHALGPSLLSSIPADAITSALNPLNQESIRSQQLANLVRRQAGFQQPQQAQRSGFSDPNSVLFLLLQQQQQQQSLQRQQQQQQQRLLEDLLREHFQRDDQEPNSG